MNNATSRQTGFLLFALGAALGSAFGLILGSLLTFWLGEMARITYWRGVRRLSGHEDQPSFELLMQ